MKHSQRLREVPLKVWIVAKKDGVVLAAHCDCMAGLGEVCSHVGGILFAVETGVRMRDRTCTEQLCNWVKPSAFQAGLYLPVAAIDFASAKKKKRQLQETTSTESCAKFRAVPSSLSHTPGQLRLNNAYTHARSVSILSCNPPSLLHAILQTSM